MKTILFVSRHIPSPAQVQMASDVGYKIAHVGDFNAFAPTGEFEAFLQKKREEATALDNTGVFGIEQRDIVVCVVHPALALCASLVGYTIAIFQSEMRPIEGQVNPVPTFSNLFFYDPQFSAPFVNVPYVPPVIPDRQELTNEEKGETKKEKGGLQVFSVSFFQLSDLLKKISDQFEVESDDFSGEFSEACSSVSYGDASHTLINVNKFIEILGEMPYDLDMDLIKSWIPSGYMIDLES